MIKMDHRWEFIILFYTFGLWQEISDLVVIIGVTDFCWNTLTKCLFNRQGKDKLSRAIAANIQHALSQTIYLYLEQYNRSDMEQSSAAFDIKWFHVHKFISTARSWGGPDGEESICIKWWGQPSEETTLEDHRRGPQSMF